VNKRPEDIAHWRKKSFPILGRTLTSGEIDHVRKATSPRQWGMVPEDWVCPGCGRSKVNIIRKTEQNVLSFSVHDRWYWDGSQPKKRIHLVLCSDCGWVAENLGVEARHSIDAGKGPNSALVGVAEIRQVVMPRNNSRHRIDNEKVESIFSNIVTRIPEIIFPTGN